MELVGLIDHKKFVYEKNTLVKDLIQNKVNDSLKIVLLNDSVLNKSLKELSISEVQKVFLASKLNDKEIILINFFEYFNHKEREYFKKLFKKLTKKYDKKIILIEPNVNNFLNLVDEIYLKGKEKIKTNNFYDEKIYEYVDKPQIIKFVNEANKKEKKLKEYTEFNELLKAIYRSKQ